jgi:AcrR family transcriptional regulator
MPKKQSTAVTIGRQAQKAQDTRDAILGAVIGLIKEGGFGNASSSRIAERAGITWGAVQHHYGSKEEILDAILEILQQKFTALMSAPQLREGDLQQRVDRFVERLWRHYQQDEFIVAVEILLASRGFEARPSRDWEQQQLRGHVQAFREIFHDVRRSNAQLLEGLTFVHIFLTGLSIERVFESRARGVKHHLDRVKASLLAMLRGE